MQKKRGAQAHIPVSYTHLDVYKRQAVMGGKADAAILDKVPAQTLAMANPDALETVAQLLTEEEMAMGVAKGNEDLLEVVNSVLQKAMDDGTVESLTDKHLKICAEG